MYSSISVVEISTFFRETYSPIALFSLRKYFIFLSKNRYYWSIVHICVVTMWTDDEKIRRRRRVSSNNKFHYHRMFGPKQEKYSAFLSRPFISFTYNLSGPAFLTAYTKSKIYFYLIVCPADRTLIVRRFRRKNVDWVEFGTSVHSRSRIPSVQSVSSRRNMIQCIPAKIAK